MAITVKTNTPEMKELFETYANFSLEQLIEMEKELVGKENVEDYVRDALRLTILSKTINPDYSYLYKKLNRNEQKLKKEMKGAFIKADRK